MPTDKKAYKAQYWKTYKKTHKRVYGTLTNQEYQTIKQIADQYDRAVWTQIWLESCAYRRQEYLASPEIEKELVNLRVQIRGVARNVDQLAKHSNTFKIFMEQHQLIKYLQNMEQVIEDSVRNLKPQK